MTALISRATPGGIVNNFAGGSITGARHGITAMSRSRSTTRAPSPGQSGAGINMDTAGTTTTIVNNSGTIIGISVEGVQSGDAVDVDGLIALNNHGLIQALGVRTGGLSEGVTVGGGTINNYADGTIVSSHARSRSMVAATSTAPRTRRLPLRQSSTTG